LEVGWRAPLAAFAKCRFDHDEVRLTWMLWPDGSEATASPFAGANQEGDMGSC
jgi:hypothetical protein